MNKFIYLYPAVAIAVILSGIGCQSIDAPGQSRSDRDVPEAYAYPVKGVNDTPIQSLSAEDCERAHDQRFDGRLSRALEPEDIQSSRQTVQFQQQTQENPVIKTGQE